MFNQGNVSTTIKNAVENHMDFTEYKALLRNGETGDQDPLHSLRFNKSQERLLSLGKAKEKLN